MLDTDKASGVELHTVKAAVQKILKPRSALALALMFWCAGAGCMMVSYARSAMADLDSQPSAAQSMAVMSAPMGGHACCKAKQKSAKSSTVSSANASPFELLQTALPPSSSTDIMSCCPLTSGSIVTAARSQSTDDRSVLSHRSSYSIQLTKADSPPLAVPLRPPNRTRAYLLDCAFLI